jgi:hypothetical protein
VIIAPPSPDVVFTARVIVGHEEAASACWV